MTAPGGARSGAHPRPRVVLDGHVDGDAVDAAWATLRNEGGPAVLDLARVSSWDQDALTAMLTVLHTAPDGLVVVTPPASSFLGVLDAADLRGIWAVYDDVRRLRLAAERLAARPGALTSGPATPRERVFGPSRAHAAAPTLGLRRRRIEEEP